VSASRQARSALVEPPGLKVLDGSSEQVAGKRTGT